MSGPAAYEDVLRGLLDLHRSEATQGFDALIGDLVAAGRLSSDDAAALRTWQREAMRAQADHLITTAAASLAAVEAVRDDTAAARQGVHAALDRPPAVPSPAPEVAPEQTPAGPRPGRRRRGRHAAPEQRSERAPLPLVVDDVSVDHGSVDDVTAPPPPVVAPDAADAPDTSADVLDTTRSHDPSARRRRLLVAGLTVIGDPQGSAAG